MATPTPPTIISNYDMVEDRGIFINSYPKGLNILYYNVLLSKLINIKIKMETISVRLDEGMINKLNPLMKKHHFATLTEFIRDAIRSKMKDLEKEEMLKNITRVAGSSKRKTTDEELHKVREDLEKVYDHKFK